MQGKNCANRETVTSNKRRHFVNKKMFGLFKSDKPKLPVDDEQRKWLEHAFMYLLHQFDHDKIVTRKVMTPTKECFNYTFNGDKKEILALSDQIAKIMEIDPNEIQIEFFESGMEGFYTNTGDVLFMGQEEDVQNPGGQYFDKTGDGKYLIALADNLHKDPDNLVATIAHEFSHIKLLGEKRLDFNDEYLTDVVPLMFGLGIFNANTCFKFKTTHQSWGHSKSGYLSQMDWGYLLALYSFMRHEDEPNWLQYLSREIQNDFSVSIKFILDNESLIFAHLKNDDENS